MQIGFVRVSTVDQSLALQRDALTAAGCEQIFTDEGGSGSVVARHGLNRALAALNKGDTHIVRKLDRLGRSLSDLVNLVAEPGAREINFRSLSDPIDTGHAGGRLVFHMMGALAEFERSLTIDRTRAGLKAVKRRGAHLGGPTSLEPAQVEQGPCAYRSERVSPRCSPQSAGRKVHALPAPPRFSLPEMG